MVWNDLGREAADANQRERDKWIGVYIGVLAVILAICTMGGDNASKEATLHHIEASNNWAFFQAKNIRRQMLRLEADELSLKLATDRALTDADKSAVSAKLDEYRANIDKLTSDDKGEGLDQLFEKGKALEAIRDRAMRQDPYFDYGTAFLQIAIVLASVAIISGGVALLIASGILGVLGCFMTINGFTLFAIIPYIG